ALLGEPTDRRAVEREVVDRVEQEFLVVIQHVKPALQVREADRDGLDALFVLQVLEALLLDLARRHAALPLLFGGEVTLFQLVVGDLQEITQRGSHAHSRNWGEAADADQKRKSYTRSPVSACGPSG